MKTLLLLLFASFLPSFRGGGGIGLVAGQLYTDFDELAKHHNLPTGYLGQGENQSTATCMARIPTDYAHHQSQFIAETYDFFRGGTAAFAITTGYNPHYFCSNVPKMPNKRRWEVAKEEGYRTPYSQFWLQDPTAWHWSPRADLSNGGGGLDELRGGGERLMKAKGMGFIFTVHVTGIKVRDRFLKGWYHLKINLAIDHHNQQQALAADYVIDKLVVTARGRILIAGKNYKKDERGLPRRAWVGGIGEFVKDFPKCEEAGYNPKEPYLTQQFMPCGAVQFSESQYGNNFYYSRSMTGEKYYAKYGNGQAVKEIHLNFRLDNSFCNRYYDLDFIANGIVIHKGYQSTGAPGIDITLPKNNDNKEVAYIVQRSVSTRFVFISSHDEHGPSYYENADPIPRGVDSVICSESLKGLDKVRGKADPLTDPPPFPGPHIFNFVDIKCKESNGGKPEKHKISVTEGADLESNGEAEVDPTASFGGSIKFIYELPKDLTDPLGKKNPDFFGSRRTWTYPDLFQMKAGIWDYWTDVKEFPDRIGTDAQTLRGNAIHLAVQRVLNEFDWETWRELGREEDFFKKARVKMNDQVQKFDLQPDGPPPAVTGPWQTVDHVPMPYANPHSRMLGCSWCKVHTSDAASYNPKVNLGVQYWPHPYYDATCVGLDVEASVVQGRVIEKTRNQYDLVVKGIESGNIGTKPTPFYKEMPQILGRCQPGLYYNQGIGKLDTAPPPCNEFFADYGIKTVDPALKRVKSAADGSARPHWETKYGEGSLERKQREQFCAAVDQLNKKYPICPYIPAQPFTPVYNATVLEAKVKIERKKAKEYEHTLAYNRGMMIAENPYSLYVYDSRILHGLVMTIIIVFITPVSIFLVRYFKETFMDSRLFLHRIWYFVHVGTAFLIPLLFIVAMWRLVESRAILGVSYSKTGMYHRFLGYAAILIALLLTFLGGFRCMNRCIRGVIIFLHFILGFAYYFISLGLVVVSVAIPGSPSAHQDFSIIGTKNNNEKKWDEFKYLVKEPIFIIVLAWIGFDLVMHIAMTVTQCCNDKKMKLSKSRICFGAGMPVLLENYRFDSPGRFCRINALRLYIFVALLVTVTICWLIRQNSPRGRGFGFMTCTHSKDEGHHILKNYNGTTCYKDTKGL